MWCVILIMSTVKDLWTIKKSINANVSLTWLPNLFLLRTVWPNFTWIVTSCLAWEVIFIAYQTVGKWWRCHNFVGRKLHETNYNLSTTRRYQAVFWRYWKDIAQPCHAVSCHVVSCCVCHVVSYHVMWYHVMSCHIMSCQLMSYVVCCCSVCPLTQPISPITLHTCYMLPSWWWKLFVWRAGIFVSSFSFVPIR